jgi:hypothetical protein
MAQFWRASRRDVLRVAGSGLGLAMALMLAVYGLAAIESRPTLASVVAALAAVAIAGSGLLYAWRLGATGLVD